MFTVVHYLSLFFKKHNHFSSISLLSFVKKHKITYFKKIKFYLFTFYLYICKNIVLNFIV